jgi:hypothetical protein
VLEVIETLSFSRGAGFFSIRALLQGLYGRNHKGVIAIVKPDPVLIAVLINREHSRLSSQVKTLERVLHAPFSDKEHQRLVQLAANWRTLLAFDDGAPKLADALEVFVAAYRQQSPDQEKLHDEVVFQAGVYRMGHWALVKHFIPGVTDCLDNFGSVLPKHRDAFKRRYEAEGNLSVEAQSQRETFGHPLCWILQRDTSRLLDTHLV